MQSPSTPSENGSAASSASATAYTPMYTTTNLESSDEPSDELSDGPADYFEHFSIYGGFGTAPEPGGTYMIRDLDSGRAITLVAGRLSLERDAGTNGGWRWHCVERGNGWLGFREAVSGRYLGHDGSGGFRAEADQFKDWESLVLRPLGGGGYHIMTIHWWTFRRMGIAKGRKLVECASRDGAARWEFIEV
ncbi:hypothetical protein DL767_000938 [Monosporascus sp. MG133]|nr:hypothetical protein DL767_000938 [Monosporascus sp. MG133]